MPKVQPLLDWLPGETLFSLVSRIHVFWGLPKSQSINQCLFGSKRAGTHHDLPSGLDSFADITKESLGKASEIAIQRTLLAYYRRFLNRNEILEITAQMGGRSVKNLKFKMGVLTSRFRANHPLKACDECITEDIESYGWAYWHLEHQYPGSWVCLKHGCLLKESLEKSTGVRRFGWHLPFHSDLVSRAGNHVLSSGNGFSSARKLSDTVISIIENDALGHLSDQSLLHVYRNELDNRGWITSGGSLRLKKIAPDYLNHVSKLKFIPEFRYMPSSSNSAESQIGRLLRPLRSGTHPLRHILIIDWLFTDARNFEEALNREIRKSVDKELSDLDTKSVSAETTEEKRDLLINRLKSDSESIRSLALELGVDTQTALIWAESAGVAINKRPKKLIPALRDSVMHALQIGMDKRDIERSFNISRPTINRILRANPQLLETWNEKRAEIIQSRHRQDWKNGLKKFSEVGLKFMRAELANTYAWLYRNDRDWLETHKPNPSSYVRAEHSTVRWDKRDEILNHEVQEAALELFRSGHNRIFLWQLYQAVPELKAKLSVLSNLPFTLRTIKYLLDWRRPEGIPQLNLDSPIG